MDRVTLRSMTEDQRAERAARVEAHRKRVEREEPLWEARERRRQLLRRNAIEAARRARLPQARACQLCGRLAQGVHCIRCHHKIVVAQTDERVADAARALRAMGERVTFAAVGQMTGVHPTTAKRALQRVRQEGMKT